MKSKLEPIFSQNIVDNIDYNEQTNSNKNLFSRNSLDDENHFMNNDNRSSQYIIKSIYRKEHLMKGEHNPKISNQFNNKKYTNNIINYCLINPNNNTNKQNLSNNFFYNIENDILFDGDEKPFPIPEPTPLKINKSTKYINISKNFETNNKSIYSEINNNDTRLTTFLHNLNLDYLTNIFKNNYVNFKDLFLLTKEDFVEMKIPIGPRNKLIYFIEQYKKNMKNFEMEDILYFFNNIKLQNFEVISLTMPSTYNNEYSNKMKDNADILFLTHSDTKRGFNIKDRLIHRNNHLNKINDETESSYRANNYNKFVKTSISSSMSAIEKKNYFNKNDFKLYSNNISSINHSKKSNSVKKINNQKNNNKTKKNYNNHSYLNVKLFNKKNSKKNNKFFFRNPMNNYNGNISSNITNNYQQSSNCKTSKITDFFNNSYINNKNKNIIQKDNNNKKRSKSIEMVGNLNNINENNILENFKSLNNEVEKFENKYKKMKRDSCERKKKIKQLLMGKGISAGNIKILKQQLDNMNYINSQKNNDNNFSDKNKNINIKKENVNILGNNDNNSMSFINKNNDNKQNKNIKTLFYELNIDKI